MILKIHWNNSNNEYLNLLLDTYQDLQLIIKYKVTLQTHPYLYYSGSIHRYVLYQINPRSHSWKRIVLTIRWINFKYPYLLRHRIQGDKVSYRATRIQQMLAKFQPSSPNLLKNDWRLGFYIHLRGIRKNEAHLGRGTLRFDRSTLSPV